MVVDAVRTYLDATSGLTELTRKRAVAAAKSLIRETGAGEAAPGEGLGRSIQALAAELIETSQGNREALGDLVRAEVAREMERRDMVPRAEYDRLARRVAELERRLASVRGGAPLWTRSAPVPEQGAVERPAQARSAPEPEAEPVAPQGQAGSESDGSADEGADEGAATTAPEDSASQDGAADAEGEQASGAESAKDGHKPEATTSDDGGGEDKSAEDAAKRKTPAKKGGGRGKSTGKSSGKRSTTRSRSGSTAKKGD